MLRRIGNRVVSITKQAEDTATDRLFEGIIESLDEIHSKNRAREVTKGIRVSASLGFWEGRGCPTATKSSRCRTGLRSTPPWSGTGYGPHRQAHIRHVRGGKRDGGHHPSPQR